MKTTNTHGVDHCGKCDASISSDQKYCHMCGEVIDWKFNSTPNDTK